MATRKEGEQVCGVDKERSQVRLGWAGWAELGVPLAGPGLHWE